MSRKYKFQKPEAAYFVSFAIVNWYNLFTSDIYFQVLVDCVNYLRKNKGMELYCYCFMPNHVHLIFRSIPEDPAGLMRDFKGFTAKQLIKTIQENPDEVRKGLLLGMFKKAGRSKSNIQQYQVWQHESHPIQVFNSRIMTQKLNYIHKNPVKAELVLKPEDWKYSSARNYSGDQSVMEIDLVEGIGGYIR